MQSQIILELRTGAIVAIGVVGIVVVAIARRIRIVVVAPTISTIVGVVSSSLYDLSQNYKYLLPFLLYTLLHL